MTDVQIGIDVSKGYADVILCSDGQAQGPVRRFDDTPTGHAAFRDHLDLAASLGSNLAIGAESTGGLERAWLRVADRWQSACRHPATKVYRVDPRAIKSMAGSLPQRCKTDPSSALAIAQYLRVRADQLIDFADCHQHAIRTFFRSVASLDTEGTKTVNRIKSLLQMIHPELMAHTTGNGLSGWVIDLLHKYPTAHHLARAQVRGVASIKGITKQRAKDLIQRAKDAADNCEDHEAHVLNLESLLRRYKSIAEDKKQGWQHLKKLCPDNDDKRILLSIIGIGEANAIAFLCEIGDVRRFHSGDALVAYCGLDPVFEQSGDTFKNKGISHRGPAALRKYLFNAARSASRSNPIIKKFAERLMSRGKPYGQVMGACMAKLLRIVYACLIAQKPFDPRYQDGQEAATTDHRRKQPVGRETADQSLDLKAPVSVRERRRRMAALEHKKRPRPEEKRDQCPNSDAVAATSDSARRRG